VTLRQSKNSAAATAPAADAAANRMWGGRFAGGPAAIMEQINASIDTDRRLYLQDIAGSQAISLPGPSARACSKARSRSRNASSAP